MVPYYAKDLMIMVSLGLNHLKYQIFQDYFVLMLISLNCLIMILFVHIEP